MKRIYVDNKKSPERRALEQEVLLRLRALRRQMKKQNPGMLEDIRARYEKAQTLAGMPAVSSDTPLEKEENTANLPPDAQIPIDREKNLRTVAAFLKLRKLSPEELKRPH